MVVSGSIRTSIRTCGPTVISRKLGRAPTGRSSIVLKSTHSGGSESESSDDTDEESEDDDERAAMKQLAKQLGKRVDGDLGKGKPNKKVQASSPPKRRRAEKKAATPPARSRREATPPARSRRGICHR